MSGAGDFGQPGAKNNSRPVEKRGPWGTTREIERRFGYPPPRRDRVSALEERIGQLERHCFPFSEP